MKPILLAISVLLIGVQARAQPMDGPLRVHPENGRYFTDDSGRAIYLTGSHTWSNFQEIGMPGDAPFDWPGYLDMLEANHHNLIRLWVWEQSKRASWTKDEIVFSPLPYQTVQQEGRERYNLSEWNDDYFDRLRQRVQEAGQQGIYVSVMLFQGWSLNKTNTPNADPWPYHPFNPSNNTNGVGSQIVNNAIDDSKKGTLHSMNNGNVLAYQEAYVEKVIETLNDLDNVLYEILNEGGTKDWQYHMVEFIKETEKEMPKQHPVGMSHAVAVNPPMFNEDLWNSPADWISPAPEPLAWKYKGSAFLEDYQNDPPANSGEKVVILDTDHLWGHGGHYGWAWKAFVRGHHLVFMDPWQPLAGTLDREKMDWMFIEGGMSKDNRDYPDWEPLRKNMGYILQLANRTDLAAMAPQNRLSSTAYCLANPGQEYIVYFPEGGSATLDLRSEAADYAVEWFIPVLNRTIQGTETLKGGDYRVLTAPFTGDAVLYLKRK